MPARGPIIQRSSAWQSLSCSPRPVNSHAPPLLELPVSGFDLARLTVLVVSVGWARSAGRRSPAGGSRSAHRSMLCRDRNRRPVLLTACVLFRSPTLWTSLGRTSHRGGPAGAEYCASGHEVFLIVLGRVTSDTLRTVRCSELPARQAHSIYRWLSRGYARSRADCIVCDQTRPE